MTPRGIRNNNPGNIERGSDWRGLSPDQSGDVRFCVFVEPVYGIRALARLLSVYQNRHGLMTVRSIINRWAPPHENVTSAYVSAVARAVGRDPDGGIDLGDPRLMRLVVEAIIRHENGVQPYLPCQIADGIALAAV